MFIVLHEGSRYSCHTAIKLGFSPRILFSKCSNTKFYENPSNADRVVMFDRRTHMTELTVAFRNFAEQPKNFGYCANIFCFLHFVLEDSMNHCWWT